MPDFRCSAASAQDDEQLAGTAPTDTRLLLVEEPGPWGAKAIADNRLPRDVREHLGALVGIRPQLIRPPRLGRRLQPDASRGRAPGTRVFHAVADEVGFRVTTAVLPDVRDLPTLDLAALTPHEGPLWLVCTNGRRDRCCAEIGRPIAGALTERWPDGTWETTHLGGHRFSGTLLALPSGFTLGRLTPGNAVAACADTERGDVPLELCRGRAGRSGAEQVLELHLMAGGSPDVEVVGVPGPHRRQSCGDLKEKATVQYVVGPARLA